MDLVRQVALETILRESEQLLRLARQIGETILGRRIEQVLCECRAVLNDANDRPPGPPPHGSAAIVKLMVRNRRSPD